MKKNRFLFCLTIILFCFTIYNISFVHARKSYYGKVKNFVAHCKMYHSKSYSNLKIIPLCAQENHERKILTLDEVMENNLITVKEISQGGSVNSLAIWNKSRNFVFIMAGEILAGSKQDRILKEDILLPPKSHKIIVKVYCVEKGRWSYKSDKFYSEKRSANISIRQAAKISSSQSTVWRNVDYTNRKVAASTSTSSLSKAYTSKKVKQKKSNYYKILKNIPLQYPKANGVIVMVNNKVLVADMFSNRRIFKKLWPKLIESYTLEAISKKGDKVTSNISSPQEFKRLILDSQVSFNKGPGAGKNINIDSTYIKGSGIMINSQIVHLDIFPKHKSIGELKSRSRIIRNYNNQNNSQIQEQRQINAPSR